MSLLALVSSLRELPMQRRFMSRPLLKTADLLLQERLPKTEASVLPEDLELEETRVRFGEGEDVMRVFKSPTSRTPEIHLLSNGRYHVAISNAGGGYSRWKDLAITRWREDATCDCWGAFLYLRDVDDAENSGPPLINRRCARQKITKPFSPRPARNSASAMVISRFIRS